MSKTIEQLSAQATEIEEATQKGENTALRVGGLFSDIVDYLRQFKASETTLNPLLRALNNSELLEPSDGQTITFSIMKDGWTFSDALTQLKISQHGIEMLVASNYQAYLDSKAIIEAELDAVDKDIRSKYADFATYRDQTSTYIAQYCTAYDSSGKLVKMSKILQTCDEITLEVSDLQGNFSSLSVEVDNITSTVQDLEGNYSQIQQTVDSIEATVNSQDDDGGSSTGTAYLTASSFGVELQKYIDDGTLATTASMELYIQEHVDADGNVTFESVSEITADKVKFKDSDGNGVQFNWVVGDESSPAFKLSYLGSTAEMHLGKAYFLENSIHLETAGYRTVDIAAVNGTAGSYLTLSYDTYLFVSLAATSKGIELYGIPSSKPSDSGYLYWDGDTLKKS